MSTKYEIVTVTTPKKKLLFGLWSSPKNPKKGVIFVHGLSSSAFSLEKVFSPLSDKDLSILKLNNRGHDIVSKLNKIDKRKKKGYTTAKIAGAAHEIFEECADDIQGAVNFIKEKGIKDIFLAGHSTGCQKSVYYLSRQGKQKQIKGLILLCAMSDYSSILVTSDKKTLANAVKYARNLVSKEKPHDLMPSDIWKEDTLDAQRFLSLYTPESIEEIFSYVQPSKKPKTLQKVKIPTLAVFAEEDEYRDRPMKEIAKWFFENSKSKDKKVKVIEDAPHSFQDHEVEVVKEIKKWLENN